MSVIISYIKKNPLVALLICYFAMSGVLYNQYGVKIVNDSARYMNYAQNLKEGFYFDPHNFWYFGYVLFIYTVQQLSESLQVLVLIQYALSAVAVVLLYKSTLILYKDRFAAFISALLYIFIVEILTWNSYILPEAIYSSALVCSFYFIINFHKSVFYSIITIVIVGFTCLVKPTGVALLVALLIPLILGFNRKFGNVVVKYAIFIMATVIVLLLINRMLYTFILTENYLTGEVIYAASTLPNTYVDKSFLMTDVPAHVYIPDPHHQPLIRLLLFIVNNPALMLKLAASKIGFLLLHMRPYWSVWHNTFMVILLYPVYFFSIKQMLSSELSRNKRVFCLIFIVMNLFIVGLTTADWDGRFLLPLLPMAFVLGSKGIAKISIKMYLLISGKN